MNKKDYFRFNANDQILVKLKEKGVEHYFQKHNSILPPKYHISCKEFKSKANNEGYHTFQMHDFIDFFGGLGMRLDLYLNISFLFSKESMYEAKEYDI